MLDLHETEENEIHKMQRWYRPRCIESDVDVILFNRTTTYLEELKRNQWNNVYYILLLYASIFGIRQIYPFNEPAFFYIFVFVAHVMFGFYVYNYTNLQYRMRNARVAIQQHKTIWRQNLYWMNSKKFKEHCENDRKIFRDAALYALFIIVGSLAFILVVVYLYV